MKFTSHTSKLSKKCDLCVDTSNEKRKQKMLKAMKLTSTGIGLSKNKQKLVNQRIDKQSPSNQKRSTNNNSTTNIKYCLP